MSFKKLTELPVEINAEAIAIGLIEMMNEDERVAIRFGLLPAIHMAAIEKSFRDRFSQIGGGKEDIRLATFNDGRPCQEFSLRKLVSEATHEVALALYDQVEMVV